MTRFVPTAEMTLGPFFPREFGHGANDLTSIEGKRAKGEIIEIAGRITQGDGAPRLGGTRHRVLRRNKCALRSSC